jgi:hypothetical protein
MHPAGEHLDRDRLGPGWAYLLQVAAFHTAGQLGQRSFQYIQTMPRSSSCSRSTTISIR